jgi:hypothetical protein
MDKVQKHNSFKNKAMFLCLTEYNGISNIHCLIKHHAIKTYWGSGGKLRVFLSSALDGGEWSASRPGRRVPPLDRRLGEPQSQSGRSDEREEFHHCPCRELNPCRPAP